MEKTILETISKHMKGIKEIGSNQYKFAEGKSCFNNLITFNKVSSLLDEGREQLKLFTSTWVKADPITSSKTSWQIKGQITTQLEN